MKKLLALILVVIVCQSLKAQSSDQSLLKMQDGTGLFVKQSGNGPLCIFVHGGPGAWSKSFENLKGSLLEKELSMVYYDQRGCGRSQNAAADDYSLEKMISDIEQIRTHYGVDKIYLMAHSFGGILAVNYAARYPEHLAGIILANVTLHLSYSLQNQLTYINGLLGTTFKPENNSDSALFSTFLRAKQALGEKGLNYKMLSDNKAHVEEVDKIDQSNPSSYGFAKVVFNMPVYWKNYIPLSEKIRVPVLVITGNKDHSIGENHYRSFRFPQMTLKKIDGGHLLYYDNNAEFIRTVFDFVHQQPAEQ
ncbi:proline iminopeptidase [Arachidicoccus rhizosphaerae]|uniref:Proline iminopeptidase n=1 Tax=Arachidicoccus rhizosphaerae TaxID=551991 RepID=A0A1H3W905_9BACT|nr:alpha/beta hydrolase [Arachidicoccus rhizosphaerae]SDZ83566.1 proline iminopeptidase [Arachidicoccus rhizosphaerae]